MWIGDDTPLSVQRNAVLAFSAQIFDAISNNPVDISGLTISCAVAAVAGGEAIFEPVAIIDDPTVGGFTVTFNGSDFDSVEGDMELVRLAYDIRIGGNAVMRGPFTLLPGVGE